MQAKNETLLSLRFTQGNETRKRKEEEKWMTRNSIERLTTTMLIGPE
jgi:hypothetical protein